MNLIKYCLALILLTFVSVSYAKLKLVAFKGPFHGFIGLKYRKPKLLGLKHHGLGLGHGLGGFGHGGFGGGGGGGGFHSSGYEHHEYHHESHNSGGSGGFGGWLGK